LKNLSPQRLIRFVVERAFAGRSEPMNKTDLIRQISDQTGVKLSEATRLVDAVFDTITANLRKGEQVAVSGFGTFVAKTKAAREGRNPATGQPIHIPSRTTASFKPAQALKDMK
jgi:DNA-binding protein HU-beta